MTTHPHRSRVQHRPMELVADIERRFPPAWMEADSFRARRGVPPIPEWPWWCYLPMAGWIAIASDGCDVEDLRMEHVVNAAILQAVGTWRMTKGIYSVGPVPPSDHMSERLLGAFPEWCMYVKGEYNFFVSLESDVHDGRPELRFLLDFPDSLISIPVHIGGWTVEEGLRRASDEAQKNAFNLLGRILPEGPPGILPMVKGLVGVVGRIVSPGAIITGRGRDRPGNPEPVKARGGWTLFPREKVRVWNVEGA